MAESVYVSQPEPGHPALGVMDLLRERYFSSLANTVVSCIVLLVVGYGLYLLYDWAIATSVWQAASAAECRTTGSGACWAVIRSRFRLILFGVFPYDEQWRAVIACAAILAACFLSCLPAFWKASRIMPVWIGSYSIFYGLMDGRLFGLPQVRTENWGGLALTFFIFASVILIGMPLATLFTLARRDGPRWLQAPVGLLVDTMRSIPLIVVLFAASLAVPLLLPTGLTPEKLFRVVGGCALFYACYQSEILRGGFQSLNAGQYEAAEALGIRYWRMQISVALPQVFRTAMPQTINQAVSAFKDTSYVAVVGFFDMTASASAALGTGDWATAYLEVYLVVGGIYLLLGYTLSQYGGYLERRLAEAYRR